MSSGIPLFISQIAFLRVIAGDTVSKESAAHSGLYHPFVVLIKKTKLKK